MLTLKITINYNPGDLTCWIKNVSRASSNFAHVALYQYLPRNHLILAHINGAEGVSIFLNTPFKDEFI